MDRKTYINTWDKSPVTEGILYSGQLLRQHIEELREGAMNAALRGDEARATQLNAIAGLCQMQYNTSLEGQ